MLKQAAEKCRGHRGFWVLGFLVLTGILIRRNFPILVDGTFVVEDGTVFFESWYHRGFACIWEPYAGYLHVATRLLAWPSQLVPLHLASAAMASASLGVMMALLAWILSLSALAPLQRWTMATVVVCCPTSSFLYLHLTHLQWFMALFWVVGLFQRPVEGGWSGLFYAVGVLLMLTGPFGVLFFPWWVLRWWRTRQAFYRKALLWWAVPLICQLAVMRASPQPFPEAHPAASAYGRVFLDQWLAGLSEGLSLQRTWVLRAYTVFAIGVAVAGLLYARPRDRVMLPLYAFALLGLGCLRYRQQLETITIFGAGARYALLPSILMLWTFVLLMPLGKGCRIFSLLFLSGCLVTSLKYGFVVSPSPPTDWRPIEAAVAQGRRVTFPIEPPDWTVTLDPGLREKTPPR